MKVATSIKLVLYFSVLILAIIFFLQNTGPVGIQVPFGRAYQPGLIYILLSAFTLGIVTTLSIVFMISAKIKKKRLLIEQKEAESEELFEED